jgi:hypothetical protein
MLSSDLHVNNRRRGFLIYVVVALFNETDLLMHQ